MHGLPTRCSRSCALCGDADVSTLWVSDADVPDLVTLCNCRFFPGLMFLIGKGLLPSLFITYAFLQRMAVIGGKRVFSLFESFQVLTLA